MTSPSAEPSTFPRSQAPRQLSEDVLQSAEEAVLVDPVAVDDVQFLSDAAGADAAQVRAVAPRRRSLGEFVAARPGQTALAAAVVGGLLAGTVRHLLFRRRGAR